MALSGSLSKIALQSCTEDDCLPLRFLLQLDYSLLLFALSLLPSKMAVNWPFFLSVSSVAFDARETRKEISPENAKSKIVRLISQSSIDPKSTRKKMARAFKKKCKKIARNRELEKKN